MDEWVGKCNYSTTRWPVGPSITSDRRKKEFKIHSTFSFYITHFNYTK